MNKNRISFLLSVICFALTQVTNAQLAFSGWSNNYTSINSFQGKTVTDAMAVRFTYSGTNLNESNWKVSVSVQNAIMSTDGSAQFPADKIVFIPLNTTGQAQPKAIPTVQEIGMPASVPLSGGSEVYLVPRSNAPLYNVSSYNSYYDLQLHYNLQIMPGAYLKDLQGGYTQKTYILALTFRAYGDNNKMLGSYQQTYQIDVFNLIDTYTEENLYSIVISGQAQNGFLELKTLADYANGAKAVYSNGLIVSSNMGYQVSVRSVASQFTSSGGSTLPLNSVKMQLVPTGSNTASTGTIDLSNVAQVISVGSSTNKTPAYYDIQYWTKPSDQQLIEADMAEYSTTLLYEITPK